MKHKNLCVLLLFASLAFGQPPIVSCDVPGEKRPWQCWSTWEKTINSVYKVSIPCLEAHAPAPEACYSNLDTPVMGLNALGGDNVLVPDKETALLLASVLVRRHFPATELSMESTVRFEGDFRKGGYWYIDAFLIGSPKRIGIVMSRQTGQVFVFGEALKSFRRGEATGFDAW
jgi:hypothetical protein